MQVRSPSRGRLPATGVALLLTLLMGTLMARPAAGQSAGCAVDFNVQHQWPGGFTASVTVSNSGPLLNGWTLTWQFPNGQQIQQAWNADVNNSGPSASVSNAPWNATIPSGGSVNFGFNGSWDNSSNGPPSSFTLNGSTCGGGPPDPGPDPDPDPDPDPSGTLRAAAEARGIEIGTAVSDSALQDESDYRQVLAREFSSVTAENVMKPDALHPSRGNFNFSRGDALVDFAQHNGQQVRGHTLVWHSQNPSWLQNGNFSDSELLQILREHVTEIVSHYRGEIYEWDVANEVLNDNGALRSESPWAQLGEQYIAEAFRAARQADPNAKLFLNDYSIDGTNAKSDAYYQLVQRLLNQGVPIDGMGFQTHLIAGQYPSSMQQNLQRFANLGLDVAITEADVRINLPTDSSKLQTQANDFRQTVEACLAVSRCTSYTVWGFTDRHSWIPDVFNGQGAATLMDTNLNPKPAYNAVLQALE